MTTPLEDLLYVEISHIDYLIIARVRDLRINKGLTQLQLTQKMKLADGFVSKVETLTERAKYNIRHLHLLAKALDCNIEDVLPLEKPEYDMVRLSLRRTNKINKDRTISQKKVTEVIKMEPI